MLRTLCTVAAASLAATAAPQHPTPPRPAGTVVFGQDVQPGYVLIAPLRSGKTFLLDAVGDVVHTWEGDLPPGSSVELLDDGSLLRAVRRPGNPRFAGGGLGGGVRRYAWDGKLLWDWRLSDEFRVQHHDVEPLANGNVLVIAWEHVEWRRALELGREPEALSDAGLWGLAILEVRPDGLTGGEVVWEWRAVDHLVQDVDPALAGYGAIGDHPGRIDVNGDHRDAPPPTAEALAREAELLAQMRALGYVGGDAPAAERGSRDADPDWLHTNSIDHHAELDLIVVSAPEFGEVWVIDHGTSTAEARGSEGGRRGRGGDLLWRWGNPRMYGAGDAEDRRLFHQHDAQWLAAKRGAAPRLLVFDNGRGRPGDAFSRVLELELPFDGQRGFARGEGRPFGPAEPAWSWSADPPESFYAPFVSSCQRLPNGNTLVGHGPDGRILEVTPTGGVVWDFWNPHGEAAFESSGGAETLPQSFFRARKLPPDHPALERRKLVPDRRGV